MKGITIRLPDTTLRQLSALAADSYPDGTLPANGFGGRGDCGDERVHARSEVFTVDRKDFSVYRRNDRQTIEFVAQPQH